MRNLFRFFYQNGFVIGFILLQLFAFWLISNYTYYQQSALNQTSIAISGNVNAKKYAITHYLSLDDANKALVEENASLMNNKLESFAVVNKEYVVIDDTLRKVKYIHFAAKVINSTYNKVENFMTLNKGSVGGIKPNMAVISKAGLVGITTAVSDNFSIVLPVIHPNSRYSVQIKNKLYFGILKWDGKDFMVAKMTEVANHAKIMVGDTVETRESDIFQVGIPVGKVIKAEPVEGSNFLDISIELFVDYSNIYYVYVIENIMMEEQHKLEMEGYK